MFKQLPFQAFLFHFLFLLLSVRASSTEHDAAAKAAYDLQNGDIVFQEGDDMQSQAVKAATHSRWSHVGIVFFEDDVPWVLEAIQPVQRTPLAHFIARSPASFYAMRLKNAAKLINNKSLTQAKDYAKLQIGKPYDAHFRWSDEQIYCSELVWKLYKNSLGVELCQPRKLGSYQLREAKVRPLVNQRYGSLKKLPHDELAVAPSDLAGSPLLIEVPRKPEK